MLFQCLLSEWVPPQPEYFYQPTGNEKIPEIVGEENKEKKVYERKDISPSKY